jgi:hypothetical protein
MTLIQLRREPAVRLLIWFLPIAALVGAFVGGIARRVELGPVPSVDAPHGLYPMLVVLWSWLMSFMLNAGITSRSSSRLDLALPLSTRRLWLTHVLAIVLSGTAMLFVMGGVVALGNLVQGQSPLLQPGMVSVGLHLAAGLIFSLALLQTPKPSLFEIPVRSAYGFFVVASLAGYLGLTLLLSTLPRAWVLVPLGIGIVLGLRTFRSLPPVFSVAPRTPVADGPAAEADRAALFAGPAGSVRGPGFAWLLHATIWRSPHNVVTWFIPLLLAFYGFVLSYSAQDDQRLPYIFFTLVFLMSWLMMSTKKLHLLDPLPVSRRRIFAVFALPALLFVAVGYGSGSAARFVFKGSSRAVDYPMGRCCNYVEVPGDHWAVAWDGAPPRITSPWGESFVPEGRAVFEGGRVILYNPYAALPNSSPEFVALQLSRAIEAVYGERIPHEKIRDRYLVKAEDGSVGIVESGLSLLDDYPQLEASGRGRQFPVVMLVLGFAWLAVAALVYRLHRTGPPGRLAISLIIGVFVVVLLVAVAMFAAAALELVDHAALSRIGDIAVRRFADDLPGGTLAIWGISLALLALAYFLAAAQFSRVEASVERPKC